MNNKLRKQLLNLDYKIYVLKWDKTRLICEHKLKTEKNKEKRYELMAKWIGNPFSSIYEDNYLSIIEELCEGEIK